MYALEIERLNRQLADMKRKQEAYNRSLHRSSIPVAPIATPVVWMESTPSSYESYSSNDDSCYSSSYDSGSSCSFD